MIKPYEDLDTIWKRQEWAAQDTEKIDDRFQDDPNVEVCGAPKFSKPCDADPMPDTIGEERVMKAEASERESSSLAIIFEDEEAELEVEEKINFSTQLENYCDSHGPLATQPLELERGKWTVAFIDPDDQEGLLKWIESADKVSIGGQKVSIMSLTDAVKDDLVPAA